MTASGPGIWALPSRTATARLAGMLAGIARTGDVIGLAGTLGTGKTTFARDFINARADRAGLGPVEVPSPTFTLAQSYDIGTVAIHHFDLYRLEAADDALELGIEEGWADGIALIEWPERLGPLLPSRTLVVTFELGAAPEARRAVIEAPGNWRDRIGGGLGRWRA